MSPSAKQDVCIDTIAELSAPLSSMESLEPLVHLLTLAFKTRSPPRKTQDRLLTLLKTIRSSSPTSSPSAAASSSHQILLNSYIHFLSPVLNGYAGMEDFESRVNAFSEPGEFREFWELEGRNLITEMVGSGSPPKDGDRTGSDVPFLEKFGGDTKRKVGLTKQGVLICVDERAQEGDEVWEDERRGFVLRIGDDEVGVVSCDESAWRWVSA